MAQRTQESDSGRQEDRGHSNAQEYHDHLVGVGQLSGEDIHRIRPLIGSGDEEQPGHDDGEEAERWGLEGAADPVTDRKHQTAQGQEAEE
jgi:hypothetical protein